MEPNTSIPNSDLTIEKLQDILQNRYGSDSNVEHFSVEPLGISGMLSKIYRVRLKWQPPGILPNSVAVKIPKEAQFGDAFLNMEGPSALKEMWAKADCTKFPVPQCHNCECAVYEEFMKQAPSDLKIAKCFYAQTAANGKAGILVLEDLSDGVATSLVHGISLDQMMEVIETVANLHAYSLQNTNWSQNSQINVTWSIFENPSFPSPAQMARASIQQLSIDHPTVFPQDLVEKSVNLCNSMQDITYVYALNNQMGLPDVLCHGDVHAQNLIFEKGAKTDRLRALLDWQISHPGNIGEDLVRLLTSSVTAEVRRNYYKAALKHYFACLEKALSETPFSYDQVLESYIRSFKYAALAILPVFTILPKQKGFEAKNGEELVKKCKGLLEDILYFEDQIDRYYC